jgi:terminal uridylyltransferase
MPKPKPSEEQVALEQELRSMILNNVRITNDKPPATADRGGFGGRGRGNFHSQNNFTNNRSQFQSGHFATSDQGHLAPSQTHGPGSQGGFGGNQQFQRQSHFARGSSQHFSRGGPGRGRGVVLPPSSTHQHMLHRSEGAPTQAQTRGNSSSSNSYNHRNQTHPTPPPMEVFIAQCEHLDRLALAEIPPIDMDSDELLAKDDLRGKLELICQEAMHHVYPNLQSTIHLQCYGSVVSGFATKGSDVDMTIRWSGPIPEDPGFSAALPRILEKAILAGGHGARLLSKTRVPILKICESPTEVLLKALQEERSKWENLPEDKKYPELAPPSPTEDTQPETGTPKREMLNEQNDGTLPINPNLSRSGRAMPAAKPKPKRDSIAHLEELKSVKRADGDDLSKYCQWFISSATILLQRREIDEYTACTYLLDGLSPSVREQVITKCKFDPQNHASYTWNDACRVVLLATSRPGAPATQASKQWTRERELGPLDFPKSGVGIQADVNFSNPLGIHNTRLLRCYSRCDPRVRPMVLFVKAWAKRRQINSAYSGTLSSYGYVLMVLHFLVNVARPPVLPNLQHAFGAGQREVLVSGYNVSFWDDEQHIQQLAVERQLTQNMEPLGALLRNFFNYFAAQGQNVPGGGFNWMRDVLSLRTPAGGILSKESKGWTGAKTTTVHNVSH